MYRKDFSYNATDLRQMREDLAIIDRPALVFRTPEQSKRHTDLCDRLKMLVSGESYFQAMIHITGTFDEIDAQIERMIIGIEIANKQDDDEYECTCTPNHVCLVCAEIASHNEIIY